MLRRDVDNGGDYDQDWDIVESSEEEEELMSVCGIGCLYVQ